MRRWGKSTADEVIGSVLFFALVSGAVFSLSCVITPVSALRFGKTQSDFLLMTVQSALAVAGMPLIGVADRKLRLDLSPLLYALIYVFLFCAVFLGEILSFYYLIPQWDTVLHFFSGVMLTLLGFHLTQKPGLGMPDYAAALFAFCFSRSLGTLWEGYEYVMDGLMHMNMQKFRDDALGLFVGRGALKDTMQDLLVDTAAAFVTALCRICKRSKIDS